LILAVILAAIGLWAGGLPVTAQTGIPYPPLPLGCSAIPGGATLCALGYVYYDAAPVAGAAVTIESPYGIWNTTTAAGPLSAYSYYQADLGSADLLASPGDWITVTVAYNGSSAQTVYQVAPGGQQVDGVLYSAWWDVHYTARRSITIANQMGLTVPAGYPVHLHFDTSTSPTAAELYADSLAAIKGDDVRVVCATELDRLMTHFSATTIDIWFALPTTLPGGGTMTECALYYGYTGSVNPPANPDNVYQAVTADANTQILYHFAEGTGTTAVDSAGNYHATLGAGVERVAGRFGYGVQTTQGTSGIVSVNTSSLNLASGITLEAWVYRTNYNGILAGKSCGGCASGWTLVFGLNQNNNSQLQWEGLGTGPTYSDYAPAPVLNAWHHLAVTYDYAAVRFFVDGTLVRTVSKSGQNTDANTLLRIGSWDSDIADLSGIISEFRISNVARTSFPYARITTDPAVSVAGEGQLVTRPIVTFNTVYPSPASHESDGVTFRGMAFPDATGAPIATYVWRSGATVLSTQASFTRTASSFTPGAHIIYFKARDDTLPWSEEVSRTLVISAPQAAPTATIVSMTPNPAMWGQDGITFAGAGTPNGDAASIAAYRWWSSLNGELSAQPVFSMPTASLLTGTHTISFTVQDDLGQWSPAATRPLTVAPALDTTWTFILYLDGDNNLQTEFQRAKVNLEALAANPQIQIVVLLDGRGRNDTWRYLIQPEGVYTEGVNRWTLGEQNMGAAQTLVNFVSWARSNYPAQHYYLAVANHGRGTEGIAWDDTNHDHLDTVELQTALRTATNNGAAKLDIVHYDACLMAMLENAYQIRAFADYLIASENLGWSAFAYAAYVSLATSAGSPGDLAAGIAAAYHQAVADYPDTISVLDLRQVTAVKNAASALGSALRDYVLAHGSAARNLLLALRNDEIQKFDSRGYYEINARDEYVDLYDLALKLPSHITDTAVISAAQGVRDRIGGATPLVIAEHHRSGVAFDLQGFPHYWNLEGAHGVSLYFPPGPGGWGYADYIGGELFDFTEDSTWDEFLTAFMALLLADDPIQPTLPPMLPLTAPEPLPHDCEGVTPPGVTPPTCCVFGYVYFEGFPVLSATVTVASAGGALSLATDYGAASDYPYYGADLSSAPVDVIPGEWITVTASYAGRSASVAYQVVAGGQHVDVVLPTPWLWGDGSDGDVTVTGVTYSDDVRAALNADALAGQPELQVDGAAGFQPGQEVLIIQMQGLSAGVYETGVIAAVDADILSLQTPLQSSYYAAFGERAQVIRIPHYRQLTIADGGRLTAHPWAQGTGGVIVFRAYTLTVQEGGRLDANGQGFAGGAGNTDLAQYGWTGESYLGAPLQQRLPNGGGGGGGGELAAGSGGGGGYLAGGAGSYRMDPYESGSAGQDPGSGDLLAEFYLGSGGGGATASGVAGGAGGRGGGAMLLFAETLTLSGVIEANGDPGLVNGSLGGGGGSGGAIRLVGRQIALGTDQLCAHGGNGGYGAEGRNGGAGSAGRIRLEYYDTLEGTPCASMPTSSAAFFGRPIATIHSILPNPAEWGRDALTFRGSGVDSDEGGAPAVAYRWQSSLNGDIGAQATFTLPAVALTPGTHLISLTVQDRVGNWSPTVARILEISGTLIPPTATITSITPNPALWGRDVITFAGAGTPNGSATRITAYRWESSLQGLLSEQVTFTISAASLLTGVHTISFTVQDDLGAWTTPVTETLEVTLLHIPPTATVSMTPNPARPDDVITFVGQGIPNGSATRIVTYQWWSSQNGLLSTQNVFTRPAAALTPGTHVISLTVEDDLGQWAAVTDTLEVKVALPPTATITDITPNPARWGRDVITFAGAGTPNGEATHIVAHQWWSSLNGRLSEQAIFSISAASLLTGTHTMSFTVQDDLGNWSVPVTETLVVDWLRLSPTATITLMTPNPAHPGDVIAFAGGGTPNGSAAEIVAYRWESSLSGLLSTRAAFTLSATSLVSGTVVLPATAYLPLGRHIISFTVQDNLGVWSDAAVQRLEIRRECKVYLPLVVRE